MLCEENDYAKHPRYTIMSYRHKHIKAKVHKLKPKNPLYKQAWFWFSLLLVVIVGLFVYFLFFFPSIQVENINIAGNQKIETQRIKEIVNKNVEKKIFGLGSINIVSKTILLVDADDITNDLLIAYPSIESVEVSKKLPQTVNVQIKERSPFAVFCKSGEGTTPPQDCYYIDTAGVIFDSLPTVPEGMIIVRQATDENNLVGENVIAQNIMQAIEKVSQNLKNNFQIDVAEAMVSTPVRLNIKTGENWKIYFNVENDVDLQITKLNLLLQDEISTQERSKLEYIDLRYKDKTYYK